MTYMEAPARQQGECLGRIRSQYSSQGVVLGRLKDQSGPPGVVLGRLKDQSGSPGVVSSPGAVLRWLYCQSGSLGAGALILYAVVIIVFILISEFMYIFNIRQSVDVELTRAVNTAVDMSMSDLHRQDKLSELDVELAYNSFFDYLYKDMDLSRRLEARSRGGALVYTLEIERLDISRAPPGISVSCVLSPSPLFISRIVPAPVRLPIRVSSANRRKD